MGTIWADGIVELVPEKLYLLGADVPVEGRTSWVDPGYSGTQHENVYLLKEGDQALLIDCGPALTKERVVAQLGQLLTDSSELSVVLSRAEFETTGGVPAIAAAFPIKAVYAAGRLNPFDGFQLAASPITGDPKQAGPEDVRLQRLSPVDSIALGEGREVTVQPAPLRMIACSWFYDTGTRALFPTDFFGYTTDTPEVSMEEAYRNLVARYWWLPGARTEVLLGKLETALDAHPIEIIAPTHGCVFAGEEVGRQRQIIREVLEHAPTDSLIHD